MDMWNIVRRLLIVASVALLTCAAGTVRAEKVLATITVDPVDRQWLDAPIEVKLPKGLLSKYAEFFIREVGGEPVPSQREGLGDTIWFVLTEETGRGEVRRFELVEGGSDAAPGAKVRLKRDNKVIALDVFGRPMLTYRHAPVPVPDDVKLHGKGYRREAFTRSAYIHPLYSPTGKLMTEDMPADHTHHKGIWQAWVNTTFKNRKIDFWNIGKETGTVRFKSFGASEVGPVFGRFVVTHEHVALAGKDAKPGAGEEVVLEEQWDVRAYSVGGPESRHRWWMLDITSTQKNVSDAPLLLHKYRYGGMAYRGPSDWKQRDYKILTSEGKEYQGAHGTTSRWCAHSGKVRNGKDNSEVTMILMCHPSNERFPENMRTSGGFGAFFNWSPVQAGDWTFKPGSTHTFRYRFLIHEGKIDAEFAEMQWRAFGAPPKVTIQVR